MFERRIPEWLRHAPAPSVRGFASLAGCEAVTRGILISVFPVAMYDALRDAAMVSSIYFAVGVASLAWGLMIPFLSRYVPRRWIYGLGAMAYVVGCILGVIGTPVTLALALAINSMATVTTFICFNAYVLDHIARVELGKSETLRLFYSALGWTVGPVLGIVLWGWWAPAPFLISGASAVVMLAAFLYQRLGNGKLIQRARGPEPNPLAFLARFFGQPRLVAGWLFAVIRSCGWWAYIVYLPIYAVEAGFAEELGGTLLSITNAGLFLTPIMLRWMQARTIRYSVRTGFLIAAALFGAAGVGILPPPAVIAALFAASFFLIFLDICGGLPFLMAVKPSERTEMSAIYSSFRDVSGIATPGIAWMVLLVAPISGIFAAAGVACLIAFGIAGRLHPRLGKARLVPVGAPVAEPALAVAPGAPG